MLHGHYTTANALINIIQYKKLWATNIKFLNDDQEFVHAISLAKEVIEKSARNIKTAKSHNHYYDEFIANLTKSLESLDTHHTPNIFTCSFSEEKDLLSQWRGYCPNNQGYCIHFDLNELLKSSKLMYKNCEVFRCIYDNSEKRKQISATFNRHWQQYIKLPKAKERKEEIDQLTLEVQRLATHFKHPSYAEEKELRLVITMDWDIDDHAKFRAGPMSIIPYIEVPAPKSHIKKIGIGPTRDQALAKRGLTALLEYKYGTIAPFVDVEVSESKIPYRL